MSGCFCVGEVLSGGGSITTGALWVVRQHGNAARRTRTGAAATLPSRGSLLRRHHPLSRFPLADTALIALSDSQSVADTRPRQISPSNNAPHVLARHAVHRLVSFGLRALVQGDMKSSWHRSIRQIKRLLLGATIQFLSNWTSFWSVWQLELRSSDVSNNLQVCVFAKLFHWVGCGIGSYRFIR